MVKMMDASAVTIAFYRLFLGAIIALPLLFFAVKKNKKLRIVPSKWLLLAGVLFALDLAVWHHSIQLAGAGIATLLANTQVFYMALFGRLFWKEDLGLRFLFSCVIAVAGLTLMIGIGDEQVHSSQYLLGVGLGVATGVIYASYISSVRMATKGGTDPIVVVVWVSVISSIFIFMLSLFSGNDLTLEKSDWVAALVLAAVVQVGGWLVISRFLPRLTSSRSGLIILLQPVLAIILGVAFFNEPMDFNRLVGVLMTLTAIYFGVTPKFKFRR